LSRTGTSLQPVLLRRLRLDRGFSLRQLAAATHISYTTLWAYENGLDVRPRDVDRLVRVLGKAEARDREQLMKG
jgi:transcriptional regulator with XRE-family HTH domain